MLHKGATYPERDSARKAVLISKPAPMVQSTSAHRCVQTAPLLPGTHVWAHTLCTHSHQCAICPQPFFGLNSQTIAGDAASIALDRRQSERRLGAGWRRPALPLPTKSRASEPEGLGICLGTYLAQLPGLDRGVTMPAPPPPASWLLEQRPPLSRLSLGNSYQQVPSPSLDGAMVRQRRLMKDGWTWSRALIPGTKAPSHLLSLGVGREVHIPPGHESQGSAFSFIPVPRARSQADVLGRSLYLGIGYQKSSVSSHVALNKPCSS